MIKNEIRCPYKLTLIEMEGIGLKASIHNISKKEQHFICEKYWGFTTIEIKDEKGNIQNWDNIYPPVTPSPPSYRYLKPRTEFIANNEQFLKQDTTYILSWSNRQQYHLKPGKYFAIVSWECDYSTKTIQESTPTPMPIKKSEKNSKGIEASKPLIWSGILQSNQLKFVLN